MITAADADFHPRDPSDVTWTETTFLPFGVPEEGIFGNVYVLARPNLGVATSSIIVSKGICTQPYQIDFMDPQVHLACPKSFTDYTLANGLSVKSTDGVKGYQIAYENKLGACRLNLNFRALHQPFDPHDPKENPLLAKAAAKPMDARVGDAWANGHFEVKGHVTGELELRGRKYKVDCYDGMDHSWGPRKELGTRAISWISVNFGDPLCLHLAVPTNIRNGEVFYDELQFGFVAIHGEVRGLVSATVSADRVDMLPIANHIVATDATGQKYEFYGTAVGGHPWYSFNPCHVSFQSLMRYRHGDLVGHGDFADIFGLDYLGDRVTRSGRHR